MAAGPAVPGLFFCFAAMVLLIFASVSAPTWNSISFLNSEGFHFGVFGYTGSETRVGWYFPAPIADSRLSNGIFHNFTSVLILIPIGAGLSGIAVICGLCGAAYHRAGTVFMSLISALALLVTLVAWVIEMVLFGVARDRVRNRGLSADWGNANWLVLGALVSLVLGFVFSTCGIFGSYRTKRSSRY